MAHLNYYILMQTDTVSKYTCYPYRKWNQQTESKSWSLMYLRCWERHLFSPQLWVNCWTEWVLWLWFGFQCKRKELLIQTNFTRLNWPSQLELQNTPTASLHRGKTPPYKCPGYDMKQSDGEALVIMELWEMWSTPSLPLLPGPLWPRLVAPDRVLSIC